MPWKWGKVVDRGHNNHKIPGCGMTGEFRHTIDAKGRLFIPSRLREELGESFYVTKGLDNCLSIYPGPAWRAIEEKVAALPLSKSRNLQRTLFASAVRCEPDAQGRIVVPQKLRDYAYLNKEVAVIGVSSRAEVWDAARWDGIESNELTAKELAESMEELGF